MTGNNADKELVKVYREFDAKVARFFDRINSRNEFEATLFVPSSNAIEAERRLLEELKLEAQALPTPNPVFSILKSHFLDFIHGQSLATENLFESPLRFLASTNGFLDFMGRKDSRDAEQRAKVIMDRLENVDEVWHGVKGLVEDLPQGKQANTKKGLEAFAQALRLVASKVDQQYTGLPKTLETQFAQMLGHISDKADIWATEITLRDKGGAEPVAAEQTSYRDILDRQLGVDLEEALSWYHDEVEKTRGELFEAAGRLKLNGRPSPKTATEIQEVMKEFSGPRDSAEIMFSRLRSYLSRAKEASKALVSFPEETCNVIIPPDQLRKRAYPWSGYGSGCPKRRPLIGEMFTNDRHYRLINDVWLKMLSVHECYPGHHVQWVRRTLDPIPETMKTGAKFVPLLEGTAHRSERLLEEVFPEDQICLLLTAYRRHQTAVRLKADLYLNYFHKPVEECVDLYVKELDFSKEVAQGQVRTQGIRPGYHTCYYYGYKCLTDMEARYNFGFSEFTGELFALGRTSLQNFEAYLRLNDAQRTMLLTEFPSVLQFGQ